MRNLILLTEKKRHISFFEKLQKSTPNYNWILVDKKEDLNLEYISSIDPKYIFSPHWSHIISSDIFTNFECIVFHMTDLPYGRGGSPLQNLIIRGVTETKISALKVVKELDAGDIYLKEDLALQGTAKEIFINADILILDMISTIVDNELTPVKQIGDITTFKRRQPHESNIEKLTSITEVYDYIRMLDEDGYPHAYFENENFKFEFTNSCIKNEKVIEANVRIIKK